MFTAVLVLHMARTALDNARQHRRTRSPLGLRSRYRSLLLGMNLVPFDRETRLGYGCACCEYLRLASYIIENSKTSPSRVPSWSSIKIRSNLRGRFTLSLRLMSWDTNPVTRDLQLTQGLLKRVSASSMAVDALRPNSLSTNLEPGPTFLVFLIGTGPNPLVAWLTVFVADS